MKAKKKNSISTDYHIYDLSSPHFANAEIITDKDKNIKGQFVGFKVAEDDRGYKIYPSEKFCFLPAQNKKEFWDAYKSNKGIFLELPVYIKELGLGDIKKIVIEPILIA